MSGTVIFAGGGTGGHIFPGLAIREVIAEIDGDVDALFVCSERAIDESILTKQRVAWRAIPARPLSLNPRRLLDLALHHPRALRTAKGLIEDARREGPTVVVATGGFVSVPVAGAARGLGVPVLLVNLDAAPGRANQWIARIAAHKFTSAEGARVPGEWERLTPIVRAAARARGDVEACRERMGLRPGMRTLFVSGGSQGAQSIDRMLIRLLERRDGGFDGWQVLHQCGEGAQAELTDAYEHAQVPALVQRFIEDVGSAWGSADLAVARAGAGSVAEAWANRVPTLFMPYPHHRDDHQRLNAEPLVREGSAIVAEDRVEAEANAARAGAELLDLLRHSARLEAMTQSATRLTEPDGAARVAEHAIRVLRGD
ncbi:MAG: UDP-N-acetylglucosamine--N-acetylmuramyl-(pentapeptide) pyrophosphoryl-undecaprenol N-acetylglucosamine transferase [Planctomycetota bacterium]